MPTLEEQRRALAEQALAAWGGGAPMVPLAGGMDPSDPVAAQDAALAAQAQQDAAMAMAGPPAPVAAAPRFVDPATVSSMPPEMSAPPEMTPQQRLAAEAYSKWAPQDAAGLAGWQPPAEAAGPPSPAPAADKVIEVPEQEITAPPPGGMTGGGGRGARVPTLLEQQNAMAAATQDEAEQAKIESDISTDMQAELTGMLGEQKAAEAQQVAELATKQQTDLENAGRVASEKRAVKEAVATDLAEQHKKLNDEAAAIQIRDSRSTGQRIMGALAIALGGLADQGNLAAGLNIGMNVQTHNADRALSMVNDAVERDLAIQRANLENKRNSAAAKYTELGIARDAIKDVDAQENAARVKLMEKYALALDAVKAQGMGEQATTTAALAAETLRGNAAALDAQNKARQAEKEGDRQWALQVQREQERKAAAAARNKAPEARVSDLLAKEADGSITPSELDTLNKLRLQKKSIDADGKGEKMSDGDKKLARLASGVQPAVESLLPYLDEGSDIPYLGVRGVSKSVPEALTPDENLRFRNSVDAVTNVLLRDESGAALPPAEIEAKKKSWGVESGSEEISREGLRRMLYEFGARKANGTLPPIDAQPVEG